MRVVWILLVAITTAATACLSADPIYIDRMMETPLAELRQQFPDLKTEGCYRLGEGPYLLVAIDKDMKPWRVVISSVEPCRRALPGPSLEIRQRTGVELGDSSVDVVRKMGRPEATAEPEDKLRRLGDTEYFYICRVEEQCARHTSIFMRSGTVTAIAEWYSN